MRPRNTLVVPRRFDQRCRTSAPCASCMKIRFQRGSVRFRLRQGEVRTLVGMGRAEESVAIGNEVLVHSLVLHAGPPGLAIEGAGLVARVPVEDARAWATGTEVGLRYELTGGTRLLVEKDWACLEPAAGDGDDDTFPRPGT